jgi:hypothetical protein
MSPGYERSNETAIRLFCIKEIKGIIARGQRKARALDQITEFRPFLDQWRRRRARPHIICVRVPRHVQSNSSISEFDEVETLVIILFDVRA